MRAFGGIKLTGVLTRRPLPSCQWTELVCANHIPISDDISVLSAKDETRIFAASRSSLNLSVLLTIQNLNSLTFAGVTIFAGPSTISPFAPIL